MLQLLILADVVPECVVTTSSGKVLIPPQKLTNKQREDVSKLVTRHLDNLFERFDDSKSGREH